LAADRQAQHLYNAARAAAMAGLGRSADDPRPDEVAKAKRRAQALGWLRSELSAWRKLAMTGASEDRQLVARALDRRKEDLDLAGVRDPPASPGSPNPSVGSGRTSGPEWTPCARASPRDERPSGTRGGSRGRASGRPEVPTPIGRCRAFHSASRRNVRRVR